MKWITLAAVVAALTFAGTASADTSASIAKQTMQFFNKRFAFAGSPLRYKNPRCQQDTPNDWFCLVTATYPGAASEQVPYMVHESNTGLITWKRQ